MEFEIKLDHIEKKVNEDISKINEKADKNKNKAAISNISSVLFGAGVTIFLGLQIDGVEELFKNIALILGVMVTVVNSINSFFNFRSLWIKQKVTLLHLYSLRNEIEFYKMGMEEDETVKEQEVTNFFKRYQEIWETSSDEWLRLRSEDKHDDTNKDS